MKERKLTFFSTHIMRASESEGEKIEEKIMKNFKKDQKNKSEY